MKLILFIAWVLAAVPTHHQMNDAVWRHVADREHPDAGTVRIFEGSVDRVTCFKATATTAGVDAGKMLEVVSDVVGAKQWSTAGITRAELLGRDGDRISFMQYVEVPGWTLASDRYWFLTADLHDGESEKWMRWSRIEESGRYAESSRVFKEANPEAIEPPINVGDWHFRNAGAAVEIRYRICTEVGGAMPRVLQRMATRRALPDAVGDVVREARRRLDRSFVPTASQTGE